jgi:hypothetical protein
LISGTVSAWGVWCFSENGIAEGATMRQPPWASSSGALGVGPQGRSVEALRPACASWIPAIAPAALTASTTFASGAICESLQMPMQYGVIRPRASTPVASVITSAAPPTAREAWCTTWNSCAWPSCDEYMHIGETPIRFFNVNDRSDNGSKSFAMAAWNISGPDRCKLWETCG